MVLATPASSVANGGGGDRVLFTTAGFDALSTPTATADFAMANIPSTYLAAGSLTFENAGGSLIY